MKTAKQKVCIISNKHDFKHDYSAFVDSCDEVFRVSKMESYSTGMTGTKCDYAVVMFSQAYLDFSDKERNAEVLKKFKKIWFFSPHNEHYAQLLVEYCKKWDAHAWEYYPSEKIPQFNCRLTTVTNAVLLADMLHPKAQLYFLGDLESAKRTDNAPWHDQQHDRLALLKLIAKGKMTYILNKAEYYR